MAAAAEVPISLRAKGYAISTQPHASAIDEKWAQYFYDHLKKQSNRSPAGALGEFTEGLSHPEGEGGHCPLHRLLSEK